MKDEGIIERIQRLVDEEHELRVSVSGEPHEEPKAERLRHLEENLDQCWDLLRQRRAKAEYGLDPAEATVRPVAEVEGYLPRT